MHILLLLPSIRGYVCRRLHCSPSTQYLSSSNVHLYTELLRIWRLCTRTAFIYTPIYIRAHNNICICIYIYDYTCMYTSIHRHIRIWTCIYIYTHPSIHIYVYVLVMLCICILYIYIYIYMCMDLYFSLSLYIYMHIYVCTHVFFANSCLGKSAKHTATLLRVVWQLDCWCDSISQL